MQKATDFVGLQYGSCFSNSQMWARKHFDCLFRRCDRPNCCDRIADMQMNSHGVTIAYLSLPSLTRPHPFTGTDRTCNRQRVHWVRSPGKGVVQYVKPLGIVTFLQMKSASRLQ